MLVLLKRFVQSGAGTRPSLLAIISRVDFAFHVGGAACLACSAWAGADSAGFAGKSKYPAHRQRQNALPPTLAIRCTWLMRCSPKFLCSTSDIFDQHIFDQHIVVHGPRDPGDDMPALLVRLRALLCLLPQA